MELTSDAAAAFRYPDFNRVWQEECLPVTRVRFRDLSPQDREDATQDAAFRLARIYPQKLAERDAALAAGLSFSMRWPAYTNTVCKSVLVDLFEDRGKLIEYSDQCQSLDHFQGGPRRYRRDDDSFPDSLVESDLIADPRATADPLAWVITGDLSSLIRRTFAALPPQDRIVMRAHLHELTDREAAAEAGLPESTARYRRLRSTRLLQKTLQTAGYAPLIKGH
jgi:DNA-directed RNA polymerase specialized sigma24 family protein